MEKDQLGTGTGKLSWLANKIRWDLMLDVNTLQSTLQKATVATLSPKEVHAEPSYASLKRSPWNAGEASTK